MLDAKFKEFIQRNIGYAAVILACGVYIATSFLNINKTGKTVEEIILDGSIVFLLGFFINRAFDLQGILLGKRSEIYQGTMILHAEEVVKVSPHLDELDEWCADKNAENLRVQRVRILAQQGMYYNDYFDENGTLKEGSFTDIDAIKSRSLRSFYRRRNKCLKNALEVRLTPISAGELTSEGAKGNDPYYFGRTEMQYERQMSTYDAISKLVIALVFGYYGVELLTEFSYANLIWHGLQVAMFVLIGAVALYNSYLFITTEHRARMVKKVNCLEMFWNHLGKKNKETEVEDNERK